MRGSSNSMESDQRPGNLLKPMHADLTIDSIPTLIADRLFDAPRQIQESPNEIKSRTTYVFDGAEIWIPVGLELEAREELVSNECVPPVVLATNA